MGKTNSLDMTQGSVVKKLLLFALLGVALMILGLLLLSWTTVFFGISESLVGCVRGMGKSLSPTVINLFFLCGVRVIWAMFVFPYLPQDPAYLFLCYPISWVLALGAQAINYIHCRKRLV